MIILLDYINFFVHPEGEGGSKPNIPIIGSVTVLCI